MTNDKATELAVSILSLVVQVKFSNKLTPQHYYELSAFIQNFEDPDLSLAFIRLVSTLEET